MDRYLEPLEVLSGTDHEISAPPPKLKKDRKQLEAAKPIDKPKTIWIRRRKTPAVSPNARVRPVTMMIITATIFANGPFPYSSTCWSGPSQGMTAPEDCPWFAPV